MLVLGEVGDGEGFAVGLEIPVVVVERAECAAGLRAWCLKERHKSAQSIMKNRERTAHLGLDIHTRKITTDYKSIRRASIDKRDEILFLPVLADPGQVDGRIDAREDGVHRRLSSPAFWALDWRLGLRGRLLRAFLMLRLDSMFLLLLMTLLLGISSAPGRMEDIGMRVLSEGQFLCGGAFGYDDGWV